MSGLPALQSTVLSNDDLSKHRAFIAVKAQGLMGRYFQVPQDELVKRDILLGWMDMLQDYTGEEISVACRQYLIDHPKTRPHEGLVRQIIVGNRKRITDRQPKLQIEEHSRKEPDYEKRRMISKELMGSLKM